jgi:O-antigen/teichoic acid export membrane protein
MSKVARRISGTALASGAVYAAAALTGPLAARLLGPDGRGTLAAIQLYPGALATFAMLGLPDAIVYFGAREPERAGQWLFTAQVIALGASCVAGIIGYPLITLSLRGYDPRVIATAHWYLLLLPLTALLGLPIQLTRALGRFGLWNALRILPGLGWLAILVVAFERRSTSPDTLAIAYLSFLGLEGIVIAAICLRAFPGTRWFNRSTAIEMLRYGVPSGLSAVPQFLNLRLDQMLIAAFLPPAQLGLYVVAVSWSGISGMALNAIGPVLFQRIAAERDVTRARALFGQASRAAIVISGGAAAAFWCLTPAAMSLLYGARFHAAVPAALILVAAAAIVTVNGVLEEGLRGLGDTRSILRAESLGLIATGVALAVLLGPLKIVGAALASVIGYAVITAGLARSLERHDVTLREVFSPRVADIWNIVRMARASWPIPKPLDAAATVQGTL